MAVADRVELVDIEAGGVVPGVPQRDQSATQLGVVDEVGSAQAQLDVGDGDGLQLRAVDDVAAELAVEHHYACTTVAPELPAEHPSAGPAVTRHTADESVADQWPAVVSGRFEPHTIARPVDHAAASASTASLNAGHSARAASAQSSKGRSVRARLATPTAGSTHAKVPAPPKCPNVDGEFVVPVQCGFLSPRISNPSPHGQGA